jgi:signal transduction histidine kinase
MGLLGMRERVTALGGTLSIEAREPRGLAVRVQIAVSAVATHATAAREAA